MWGLMLSVPARVFLSNTTIKLCAFRQKIRSNYSDKLFGQFNFLFQESEHGTSMHNGHHNRKNSKIANASGSQNTVAQKSVPSKRAEQNKTDCLQSSAKQCSETSVGEGSRKTVEKKQNGAGFGGLKKGFLFGGSSKLKSAKEKSCSDTSVVNANSVGATSNVGQSRQTLEDIPFVTKNEEAKTKNLQFSEVQEAMAKTNEKLMENKGESLF